MIVASLFVNALACVALAHGAWWTVLSVVALKRPGPPASRSTERPSITTIVPAHNEEQHIERTVQSLDAAAARYGPALVLVVADNCTDATATLAMRAGAIVLERSDDQHRGKSYALEFAIDHLRTSGPPHIVAFVDADSTVSPNFFEAIAAAISGETHAIQMHYATAEGETSLQRLRRVAFMLAHWSRQLGAGRLGLGTGIKGNGMAFRWELAARGIGGYGVTEDAAMTLSLAARGIPVRFVPHATVWGHMPGRYDAARTQDTRWEGGRFSLVPRALTVAIRELVRGRIPTAAAAMEVASLPLSILVAMAAASTGAAVLLGAGNFGLAALATASLVAYVGIGLAAAGASRNDVLALAASPRFLLHKATVYLRIIAGGQPREWQRTERHTPPDA